MSELLEEQMILPVVAMERSNRAYKKRWRRDGEERRGECIIQRKERISVIHIE